MLWRHRENILPLIAFAGFVGGAWLGNSLGNEFVAPFSGIVGAFLCGFGFSWLCKKFCL